MFKIALIGNPNSGKTTIFNILTGRYQYVGNWPGVTVEKKEGRLKLHKNAVLIDLPGIYSLSPYSPEEIITRNFLLYENPDIIINVIDASNIERNLYLTLQLLDFNIPMVISLNMIDIVNNLGTKIDIQKLSQRLGCPIIETSGASNIGLDELSAKAITLAQTKPGSYVINKFSATVESSISEIEKLISASQKIKHAHFHALKLFEKDPVTLKDLSLSNNVINKIETILSKCEKDLASDSESIIINERYSYVENIVKSCVIKKPSLKSSISDKIDKIMTDQILAIPLFFIIMWGIYYISVQTIGNKGSRFAAIFIKYVISNPVSYLLLTLNVVDWLRDLIVEGIINGVGAVIVFLPQLIILFSLLSFLEDCGYMSRIAFIMDRIFKKIGLSGKSFIPMLIGTGCSVPGIMASRTINNERDRRVTIMLTPFIPCGAKLPVFALFTSIFFREHSWVGATLYILGIIMIIISGLLLKHIPFSKGEPPGFLMELPPYRIPRVKNILLSVYERSKSFLIKTGTIIFLVSGVVWFLQHYNFNLVRVNTDYSILALIGNLISPVFIPLGFGNREATISILMGTLAKENMVAAFGILLNAKSDTDLISNIYSLFTPLSAYSFMVFTLLASPCVAAIGTIKKEMHSLKWTLFALVYQTGTAYIVSLFIYQIGSLISLMNKLMIL